MHICFFIENISGDVAAGVFLIQTFLLFYCCLIRYISQIATINALLVYISALRLSLTECDYFHTLVEYFHTLVGKIAYVNRQYYQIECKLLHCTVLCYFALGQNCIFDSTLPLTYASRSSKQKKRRHILGNIAHT